MRYRHITIGLIVLSLTAITFVATVAATTYYPNMYVDRKGRFITFTIDTASAGFSGLDVAPNSIVITIYDINSNPLDIYADSSSIASIDRSADCIVVRIFRQDLPPRALASHATGNIGTSGDTFYASGPGWAFGNVH